MIDEDAARGPAKLAGDHGTRRFDLRFALGRREPNFDLSGHDFDVDQLRQEIRVPHLTPEFSVGGHPKTHVHLHLHRVADRGVLALFQLLGRNIAACPLRASRKQSMRSQQAADMVGTKRRRHALSHNPS